MRQRLSTFRAGSSLLRIILLIVQIGRFDNLAACSGVSNGSAWFGIRFTVDNEKPLSYFVDKFKPREGFKNKDRAQPIRVRH
jgi:hypothetical protein